jgi:hypothetical protein
VTADQPARKPVASWRTPLIVGAVAAFVFHAPLLVRDFWWIALDFLCGCTGVPSGLLATGLALRHDPRMGAASGFAVAFMANGIGALFLALIAIVRGFHLQAEDLETLHNLLREGGRSEQEVRTTLDGIQRIGAGPVVLAAMLLAFSGGAVGAVAAGLYGRYSGSRRGARGAPPRGPAAP